MDQAGSARPLPLPFPAGSVKSQPLWRAGPGAGDEGLQSRAGEGAQPAKLSQAPCGRSKSLSLR